MTPAEEPPATLSRTAASKTEGSLGHVSSMVRVAALLVGAALLGAILASVAQYWFFVGALAWLNLVFWTIIAISVGAALRTWAMTIPVSAIVGFAIVLVYSIIGYHANAPLPMAMPAFVVLAIFGALGMAAGGAIGHLLRRLGRRARAHHGK